MSKQVKKPITAQEQLEMDIMAETELGRLQRQYRIMDGDRKAFEEESKAQLQKQGKIIKLLNRERNQLLENLNVAESKNNKRKDMATGAKMEYLINEYENYEELIKKQKTDLKEIEYQIKKVQKDVLLRKKQVDQIEKEESKISASEKSVEILKNKLGNCVTRFCTVLAENKKLREEIDHLLRERVLFNTRWHQQVERLNQGKKMMMDLIEQASLAYDQREEWCQKLQALRVRAHNDLVAHMGEMRELFRQLDHDANLQDFLSVKGQRRIMKDLEMKEAMKRQQAKENLEKELLHYKETLAKVQELAQEEDITKLASDFIKQEEENFALFNYVNELNHELETLSENISTLYTNIDEQREINEKRAEEQKDSIDSLKAELKKHQEEENAKKETLQQQEKDLQAMLKGIELMFEMVNCDSTPILNLLGEKGDINTYNVLIYLGILENRVTELIKLTNYKEKIQETPSPTKVIQTPEPQSYHIIRPTGIESPCSVCAEWIITAYATTTAAVKVKDENEIKALSEKDYYGRSSDVTKRVLHAKNDCTVFSIAKN